MKTIVVYLMLLAATAAAEVDEDKSQPAVSALYTLAGFQRSYSLAQASFHVESRSLPDTPARSSKEEKLRRHFEEQQANFFNKALELAKVNFDSEAGFAALEWILKEPESHEIPAGTIALDLLTQHYSEHPDLGNVIADLVFYLPPENTSSREKVVELLNVVAARNPNRIARGHALFGKAIVSKDKFKVAEVAGSQDMSRLAEEAEGLFETVIHDYGECIYLRTIGLRPAKPTLREEAKSELMDLRLGKPGQAAPEVNSEDLAGAKFRLSDYRGKVVLLVFWASWCGPCMADVPYEREIVARFADRPFVFLGVNCDSTKTNALQAVSEHKIPWRSFWDGANGRIANDWSVRSWPTVYVLDHEGIIRHRSLRGESLDKPIEKLVRAAETFPGESK